MATITIGLVGENGSGKGTFVDIFRNIAEIEGKTVKHLKFSDVLVETLKIWSIPLSRENLQKLPVAMETTYGKGCLTQAVRHRIQDCKADFIILDGIRWETDVAMLRNLYNNILIYITANPTLRHERMLKRKEKAGEEFMSFEQFTLEEQAPTEIEIPKLGAWADYWIENNTSPEDFKTEVERFYRVKNIIAARGKPL